MQFSTIATALMASSAIAIAIPAPAPETDITVTQTKRINVSSGLERRQETCNLAYCQMLYDECFKTCQSLTNGDW
jgi:hypothetical protein